jgi:hypothetical protein
MSISEYTAGLKKNSVGMTAYLTPSNEMVLKRPTHGKITKSPKVSYIETIMNNKKKRCPNHSYQKIEAFDAQLPKKHNKFFTTERRSVAGDIYHRAKKKETSSPSVHEYNPDVWRKRGSIVKPLGNYKLTAAKVTFAEEAC